MLLISSTLMIAHSQNRWVKPDLADLAASIGFGRTIEGARVDSMWCNPASRKYWFEGSRTKRNVCDVRIRGAISHDYAFRTGYTTARDPGRVAMVGERVAVAWPAGLMATRLISFGVTLVVGSLVFLAGLFTLGEVRKTGHFIGPGARIVDVDLLRRKMLARGAVWDFAYDLGGERRYASALVNHDPVITDGVVTRGAAILSPDGEAQLLTVNDAAPALDEGTKAAIARAFNAARPALGRDFEEFVQRVGPGPERDYLVAYGRAWHDPDIEQINAAIRRRHDTALALPVERVDRLLRDCRSFVAAGQGQARLSASPATA
jgi:hypothetical protein